MSRTFPLFLLLTVVLGGCVSSETVSRRSEPSDDAADRMYDLGAQYYRNGNYALARDRLQRAVDMNPRNATAHYVLALSLVKLGNDRLATEAFTRSVRLEPDNKDVRNAYGVFLCDQGRYEEALEQFDRAIAIRTNDNAWIEMTNAGVCIAQKPDLARAEQYFRDALNRRNTYGEAQIQLAALLYRNEDFLSARAFLERYLASNPSSPPVLYLGIQIETSLDDQRAATDYENALIRSFPESDEARLILSQGN